MLSIAFVISNNSWTPLQSTYEENESLIFHKQHSLPVGCSVAKAGDPRSKKNSGVFLAMPASFFLWKEMDGHQ
jgi:hypothetical protein